MKNKIPIIGLLQQRGYLIGFVFIFLSLFYSNYYVMAHLPGEYNLMCVIGAGLTLSNLLFALLMSLLVAFIVIGFIESMRQKLKLARVRVSSVSFLGLVLGTLTTFCTLCTLPVLTLFGFSVSLAVFTDYESYFKVFSLLLLALSFYLVNRALAKNCPICIR